MISIKSFTFNLAGENTYLLFNTNKDAVLIDCGASNISEWGVLQDFIEENELKIVDSFATHNHFDHVWGAVYAYQYNKIKTRIPEKDLRELPTFSDQLKAFGVLMQLSTKSSDIFVSLDRQIDTLLGTPLKILHVPGHSPGHVAYYLPDEGLLFSGDVLFNGSIGRTDLWGGSYDTLIRSINEQLYTLPDDTKVFSGHGPVTTIGVEKHSNPFVRV